MNEAIPIADQNNVCAADHESSQQRSAAVAGMCAEAICVGVKRDETCLSSNTDCKRTTSCPGTRLAAEPATRLQLDGLVWVLRCPHRVYDVEQRVM